jgi:AraC-like DNA-binding protein
MYNLQLNSCNMKPSLEYLPKAAEESFVVKHFEYAYYPTPWHYHPEYELVLVTESTGKRFIGDKISDFVPGNLAFIGANLPHTYRNDKKYYQPKSSLKAKSIVVHFLESTLGNDFLLLPEAKKLRALFAKAARGLDITGKTNVIVSAKMHELLRLNGLQRWIKLVEILALLSETKEVRFISGVAMEGKNEREEGRLDKVTDFVLNNFQRNITIAEVAGIVHMAENSFSRYFSKNTRKTFSAFVSEIRLGHACRLLIENKLSVTDICFECGFNNLSNFNRQFRSGYNVSPLAYRKVFLLKS